MKKKCIKRCILIGVVVVLVAGLGMLMLRELKSNTENTNRIVCAGFGETIRIEELVSDENYKSAVISPEIIITEAYSDAKISDDGQSVHMGYTVSSFDVIVYVTDEEGNVTEERVTVVPTFED